MVKTIVLSINSVISWTLKILLATTAIYFMLEGNYPLTFFAISALAISLIPAVINHSYDTNLPWIFDFWLTLWMALTIVGEFGAYEQIEWWDDVLHFGGTAIIVYLAFVLVYALNFTGKLRLSIPFIGFFTFMTGMAFGAIWELIEFWVWRLTGRDTLATQGDPAVGFFDTFSDLQLDFIGAILAAAFGMIYIGRQRHVHLREWMRPFVKIFGREIRRARVLVKEKKEELKAKVRAEKNALKKKLNLGSRKR